MKKIIFIILFLIYGNNLFSQKKLSYTEKLVSVAKVWGFLKYYHPEIANGKYNWDEELFKILPKVKNSDNTDQLSELYIEWIDNFGEIRECGKCQKTKEHDYFNKNFNLKWISNEDLFTKEISDKLKFIEINRHQGKKHYVTTASKRVGNIEVTNEIEYKDFDWQNENLRMLTLFRYWNIIEYFFPYKYQTDTNWDKVLQEMIPKFSNPKSEIDFHLAMLELIVKVDDSHAGFVTDKTNTFFGYQWIPAKFKLIDGKAIITGFYNDSLAKKDDLRVGDIITTVNNQKIEAIFDRNKKYINGSNLSRKKANSYYSIFNGSSDSVGIEFIRNNQTQTKTIKRYRFKEFNYKWQNNKDKFKILDGNIGYVNMGIIKLKEVQNIMDSLINTKAIIFDIRNYPNGTLYSISNYLTSAQRDFFKFTYPDLNYPGKFIWQNGNQCGENGELKYKGKVIILVNEKSQSHAEFTAMCLQTGDNVTTIGSQTSGADGNVVRFNMVGGYKTQISGVGIFYPDGTEAQRKGVKIDIEVTPTIEGITNGKDEILEKAIEFLNK